MTTPLHIDNLRSLSVSEENLSGNDPSQLSFRTPSEQFLNNGIFSKLLSSNDLKRESLFENVVKGTKAFLTDFVRGFKTDIKPSLPDSVSAKKHKSSENDLDLDLYSNLRRNLVNVDSSIALSNDDGPFYPTLSVFSGASETQTSSERVSFQDLNRDTLDNSQFKPRSTKIRPASSILNENKLKHMFSGKRRNSNHVKANSISYALNAHHNRPSIPEPLEFTSNDASPNVSKPNNSYAVHFQSTPLPLDNQIDPLSAYIQPNNPQVTKPDFVSTKCKSSSEKLIGDLFLAQDINLSDINCYIAQEASPLTSPDSTLRNGSKKKYFSLTSTNLENPFPSGSSSEPKKNSKFSLFKKKKRSDTPNSLSISNSSSSAKDVNQNVNINLSNQPILIQSDTQDPQKAIISSAQPSSTLQESPKNIDTIVSIKKKPLPCNSLTLTNNNPTSLDPDKSNAIWCMSFSLCGNFLAAAGQSGVLYVWKVNSPNKEEHKNDNGVLPPLYTPHSFDIFDPFPFRVYVGHQKDILDISWSKNGFILSASVDRTVKLWHPDRTECLRTFLHPDLVSCVAFHPVDDRYFVSGCMDNKIRIWDIPNNVVGGFTAVPDEQVITAFSFSNSVGTELVVGTFFGSLIFYNIPDFSISSILQTQSDSQKKSRGRKITGISFFDSQTHDFFNPSETFSSDTNAEFSSTPGPKESENSLSDSGFDFNSNTKQYIVVSSNDSTIRIFDPNQKRLLLKLRGHTCTYSKSFGSPSSDGKVIISGSEDKNIYLWKLGSRRYLSRTNTRMSEYESDNSSSEYENKKKPNLLKKIKSLNKSASKKYRNPKKSLKPSSTQNEVESISGYEYFNGNNKTISVSLFAPLATLKLLALSGDNIINNNLRILRSLYPEVENEQLYNMLDPLSIIISSDYCGNIKVYRKYFLNQEVYYRSSNSMSPDSVSSVSAGKSDH
ncbi:hypothetical protein BB560_003863 [Smittium megazygosporum]|uniref:Uncharacterized protein n=1 Tax=Smittium megazygosporum TaxID=133381 RepID=A0A2T9ZAY5_9FUNG|nr:hypothetical protein BB560_003863 [Smittium megazygosporum]